jgi:hypothetical protein
MPNHRTAGRRSARFRRGSVYLAVIGISAIVVTIAVGAILAGRVESWSVRASGDATEARLHALTAIEMGRLWISQDANWRSNRPNGTWAASQPFGKGTFALEATDPVDANLAGGWLHPVILKGTGIKGLARQKVRVTLNAAPVPLPALRYAIHTAGQLHVDSGKELIAFGATVSTNGSLRNDGLIVGSVEAASASSTGTITGTLTLGAPPKSFPDPNLAEMYAQRGTLISPGNTINKQVFSPGVNPYGATNPDGVYVIRSSANLTITNTRVNGTLVVICPGKTLTLDGQLLFEPYRADYPALIVKGDVVFQYTSPGTPLSEAGLATNFNPPGAPYQGVTNTTMTDSYPSEIRGLIHVTGTVLFSASSKVRGALLCESAAATDAVRCSATPEIVCDPNLYANPPEGYTQAVNMVVQQGSWQASVD